MSQGTSDHEFARRLADLKKGPWVEDGSLAAELLTPPKELSALAYARVPIDLEALPLGETRSLRSRNAELRVVLRPHWSEAITEPDQVRIRDSFDAALTHLQILELAVETGYLREDDVQEEARTGLLSLLWSPAARRFVNDYDYIAVDFLAARFGVAGLRDVRPPSPDPTAAIRFAGFLSQETTLSQDTYVDEWLAFLDDYVEEEGEQDAFYEYLELGVDDPQLERFQRLAVGAQRFVVYLADLFGTLTSSERPRFGLFYQYWLARMFAYELIDGVYVRDTAIWDGGDSWIDVIRRSPILRADAPDVGGGLEIKSPWDRDLAIVSTAWEETKAFASAAKAPPDSGLRETPGLTSGA